jgi:hypothetical protein
MLVDQDVDVREAKVEGRANAPGGAAVDFLNGCATSHERRGNFRPRAVHGARILRDFAGKGRKPTFFTLPPCGGTPNSAFLPFRRSAESQKTVFCSSAGRRRPKKEPLYPSAERKKPKNRFFTVLPDGGTPKNDFLPFRRAAEGRTRACLVFRHTAEA